MNLIKDKKGATALEFAILLPIWLIIFFALIDFGWYLTYLTVTEHAVANGARAGIKVQYWSDEGQDPEEVAATAVRNSFWLPGILPVEKIQVSIKDADNNPLDTDFADYTDYEYLEVRVHNFEYPLLAGYLGQGALPRHISAMALMAFP